MNSLHNTSSSILIPMKREQGEDKEEEEKKNSCSVSNNKNNFQRTMTSPNKQKKVLENNHTVTDMCKL